MHAAAVGKPDSHAGKSRYSLYNLVDGASVHHGRAFRLPKGTHPGKSCLAEEAYLVDNYPSLSRKARQVALRAQVIVAAFEPLSQRLQVTQIKPGQAHRFRAFRSAARGQSFILCFRVLKKRKNQPISPPGSTAPWATSPCPMSCFGEHRTHDSFSHAPSCQCLGERERRLISRCGLKIVSPPRSTSCIRRQSTL